MSNVLTDEMRRLLYQVDDGWSFTPDTIVGRIMSALLVLSVAAAAAMHAAPPRMVSFLAAAVAEWLAGWRAPIFPELLYTLPLRHFRAKRIGAGSLTVPRRRRREAFSPTLCCYNLGFEGDCAAAT